MIKDGENYIKINDKKVHFYVEGSGENLIMLRGWGSAWKEEDRKIVKYLKDHFRVILPDLPGFGESEEMKKHTMKEYSEFLFKFTNHLKLEKTNIVGSSMGSLVLINYSLEHPKSIKKIILVGVPFEIKVSKLSKIFASERFFKSFLFRNFVVKNFILYWLAANNFKWETAKSTVRDLYKSSPKALDESIRNVFNSNVLELYKRIKVPNLVIYGNKDTLVELPNGKIKAVFIKNTGHSIYLDSPEELAGKIISFFKSK